MDSGHDGTESEQGGAEANRDGVGSNADLPPLFADRSGEAGGETRK